MFLIFNCIAVALFQISYGTQRLNYDKCVTLQINGDVQVWIVLIVLCIAAGLHWWGRSSSPDNILILPV